MNRKPVALGHEHLDLKDHAAVKTRHVFLPSAGALHDGYWTPHAYVGSRAAELPSSGDDKPTRVWEHLFECQETSAVRRWGYT